MEYSDSHHKRTHFTATSYVLESGARGRRITFKGHGLHASVVLLESGPSLAVIVPEFPEEFALWKVQILERSKWLTLDFKAYPLLSRILVHIDALDQNLLAAELREMIGSRKLLFHHFREAEPNQPPEPTSGLTPGRGSS